MATDYEAPIEPPSLEIYLDEDYRFDTEGYQKAVDDYLAVLATEARRNGDSDLLGEVIKWARGDGYAMYMVWRTKPLEVIHLPIGDAWTVEEPLIRGLNITDVKEMVAREKRFQELFSR
jgi:hypothetical protein